MAYTLSYAAPVTVLGG